MGRGLAFIATVLLLACGDSAPPRDDPQCELLDPDGCTASSACELFTGIDVTSTDATGAACFGRSDGTEGRMELGCFERPPAGNLVVSHAYDPATGRCFEVPTASHIPPGWPTCDGALPMCP